MNQYQQEIVEETCNLLSVASSFNGDEWYTAFNDLSWSSDAIWLAQEAESEIAFLLSEVLADRNLLDAYEDSTISVEAESLLRTGWRPELWLQDVSKRRS
jgi:hypothetical protein